MGVCAIFGASDSEIDKRVSAVFPDRKQVGAGSWLVAYPASLPADVYQTMRSNGGDVTCIVASITTYYGWYDKAVWDWIESHRG